LSTAVGDEGGFAPTLAGGTEDALDTKLSVENAGYW
jgi:enolase